MKKIAPTTFIYMMIIIISIIALIVGICIKLFESNGRKNKYDYNNSSTTAELVNNFNTIFNNELRGDTKKLQNVKVKDSNKNIIYTGYEKKDKKDNKYDVNVNIPVINIECEEAEKFNKKMERMFLEKINNIISMEQKGTVFTVEYTGYINENILSIIVKASLKEDNNTPQRVIIQTFNLNLNDNQQVKLQELIDMKNLKEKAIQEKVMEVTQELNNQSQELAKLGYDVYIRDLNSDIYRIDKTTEYFLGEDNNLYIVYAYGNRNFTSELDILIF